MEPEINNPGFVRALEEYVALRGLGPEEMINWDVADTRVQFPAGCCVFTIDWGDVGPISYNPNASVIMGQTGFSPLPGGSEYWDSTAGAWVTPESGVNRAPFIAFGGWIIGIAAGSDVQEAAMDFAAFMARPELVRQLATIPDTGINPSRFSQLNVDDVSLWVDAGFDEIGAVDYLSAILEGINDPNVVLDLRIRGSAEYLSVLDTEISRALVGEITAQEALDNVAVQWNAISDRLGRDVQLEQYRASVGYTGG